MEVGEGVGVVEADEGEYARADGGDLFLVGGGGDGGSFDSLDDKFHCRGGGGGLVMIEDGDGGEKE